MFNGCAPDSLLPGSSVEHLGAISDMEKSPWPTQPR